MALKIRLQRHGSKAKPIYRLVVTESKSPRDGRFVELLGHYNPQAKGQAPEYKLNINRIEHWIGIGAQPTDTAKNLVKRAKKKVAEKSEKGEVVSFAAA